MPSAWWRQAGNDDNQAFCAREHALATTQWVRYGRGVEGMCREHRAMGGWLGRIPRSAGHGIARARTGLSMGRMAVG